MASANPQKPRPRKTVGAVQAKRHSLRPEGYNNDTPAVIYILPIAIALAGS